MYFKSAEQKETLTKDMFNPNAPLVERCHTYPSGAVYIGQWKGGMRFGIGLMTWKDKSRYEGEWEYNQISGEGTFKHKSGDSYTGTWSN